MSVSRFPEQVDYADTGCDLQPSCLRCALPMCRYDMGDTAVFDLRRELIRQSVAENPNASWMGIAARHGVSVRTVQRAVLGK